MVLTRAQNKSTTSMHSNTNPVSPADLAMTDSREDSDDSSPEPSPEMLDNDLGLWPRSDARSAARKFREKLAELELQRKKSKAAEQFEQATLTMDPFTRGTTAGFEFARTLDSTDGPGSVGVVVDSYSYAPIEEESLFRAWQLQRQQATQSTAPNQTQAIGLATTELDTMGLFALLPAELRNCIYRLALVMPTTTESLPFQITMERETCTLGPCSHSRLPTGVPGLLSTCRQIRAEAMPIFVAENIGFRFDAGVVAARCAANWIRALGWYARLIQKVVLVITVFESYGVTRDHEIVLICPQGHVLAQGEGIAGQEAIEAGLFEVKVDAEIEGKADKTCAKLKNRVQEWNDRLRMGVEVEMVEMIREFVGSDWMSDVVWRVKKG